MKYFRMHDKSSSWLNLQSHTLFCFSPIFEKGREGQTNKGLIVSKLYWSYSCKVIVRHYLAYRHIYRFTRQDDNLLLTPETIHIIQENFEGIDNLPQYLEDVETSLKAKAEDFEMSLLEGEPFPEPEEMESWSGFYSTVTLSGGRKIEL